MSIYRMVSRISKLAGFLVLSTISAGAQSETKVEKYKSQSIPGLELCKEFKDYLERHPDELLYCGLIPDSNFKGFRLPSLLSAPKGMGERITFQSRTVVDDDYKTLGVQYQIDEYRKSIESLVKYGSSANYQIGTMDINHDGRDEPVLVTTNTELCLNYGTSFSRVTPYHKSQNIDSNWINSGGYPQARGEPFFYKGRVYFITGSKIKINLYEPSTFGSNKLFVGKSVCTYIPSKLKTKN